MFKDHIALEQLGLSIHTHCILFVLSYQVPFLLVARIAANVSGSRVITNMTRLIQISVQFFTLYLCLLGSGDGCKFGYFVMKSLNVVKHL